MANIDRQMLELYKTYTSGAGKVTEEQAISLIHRAVEIDENHSSSYHHGSSRGNKYLTRILEKHERDFSPEGMRAVTTYLTSGQIYKKARTTGASASDGATLSQGVGGSGPRRDISSPRPGSAPSHPADSAAPAHARPRPGGMGGGAPAGDASPPRGSAPSVPGDVAPSRPSRGPAGDAGAGLPPRRPGRPPVTGGAASGALDGLPPTRPSTPGRGVPPSGPSVPASGPSTPPVTTAPVSDPAPPAGAGKVFIDFTAKKSTWGCHWFPMQERVAGGDPTNNLYAVGGPLDKFDKVTGRSSRTYEHTHHRKAVDAGRDFLWWGHCNNAAEAACILPAPKHGVVMTGRDGSEVKFTINDIQGLLVKVTPCLITAVDFKGDRYDGKTRDNPEDPLPHVFLDVMKEWEKDGLPFVLDIDRGPQVWNFPYDKMKVVELSKSPEGFDASGLPTDGSVKFYHIDMSGTGYDEKRRVYECYVQRSSTGEVIKSGWIKTPNTHNNCDFMWRPHPVGDIMSKSTWVPRGKMTNPEVDPQMVYDIYMKSLA